MLSEPFANGLNPFGDAGTCGNDLHGVAFFEPVFDPLEHRGNGPADMMNALPAVKISKRSV